MGEKVHCYLISLPPATQSTTLSLMQDSTRTTSTSTRTTSTSTFLISLPPTTQSTTLSLMQDKSASAVVVSAASSTTTKDYGFRFKCFYCSGLLCSYINYGQHLTAALSISISLPVLYVPRLCMCARACRRACAFVHLHLHVHEHVHLRVLM